jgi:hypothetical protein
VRRRHSVVGNPADLLLRGRSRENGAPHVCACGDGAMRRRPEPGCVWFRTRLPRHEAGRRDTSLALASVSAPISWSMSMMPSQP